MTMSAQWELVGRAGSYEVWRVEDEGREIWNVTDVRAPSEAQGGYYELDALLRLKGLTIADFVAIEAKPRL